MTGYRGGGPDGLHRGLPSSRLTFIVSLDDGVEAAAEPDGLPAARPNPLVLGGLHVRTSWVRQRPGQAGVQLAVHPLAARSLFGVPAAELSVDDFAGADVLGAPGRRLHEQLCEAGGWDEAFARVGDHLVRHRRDAAVRPELRHAWALLEGSGGRRPVAEVAREVGFTARHLDTLFQREVGRSPKTVARLIRFERATTALAGQARVGRVDLAGLAARCGYSDQSHLSRDFVAFTALPPRRWVAEELWNIQSGGHRSAAPSEHEHTDPLVDPAGP
ncbi:AraC family transcriptional regulator [Desertihabitans brevis]|uniref:AraC family transcriptional regulator n=2 Tax=Desertihabitans brevis TaxID=2268447 RepID=A0A367YXZ8_9ACTN|nr:AraC family transcriptional regulator [Desertihabitans brevis]